MNRSELINELSTALAMAQSELRNPAFDSFNPHFKSKFASLAGVRDAITPTLAKHGIAVLQLLGFDDGRVTCETVLTHKSGQWISGTFSMPPTKSDPQGTASAATYCRRYSLMGIVNVVGDEDDDGNAASKSEKPAQRISEQESRLILDSLREAAVDGLEALQTRFKSIPNSPAKTQVWSEHQASLKAAAVATQKVPA